MVSKKLVDEDFLIVISGYFASSVILDFNFFLGAETPVYLALLPPNAVAPHGEFVSEKKVQNW